MNSKTYEVDGWFGLVPEQSIGYITAGKNHIYATSRWLNSGLPYKFEDKFWLLRLDTGCNIVWSEQFELGQFPECVAVVGDRLFMSMRDRLDNKAKIYVYDEQTMEKVFIKELESLGKISRNEIEEKCVRAFLPYGEDKLVVFIDNKAHLVDAVTLQILQTAQLDDVPHGSTALAIGKDKTIYFALTEKLYRLVFD